MYLDQLIEDMKEVSKTSYKNNIYVDGSSFDIQSFIKQREQENGKIIISYDTATVENKYPIPNPFGQGVYNEFSSLNEMMKYLNSYQASEELWVKRYYLSSQGDQYMTNIRINPPRYEDNIFYWNLTKPGEYYGFEILEKVRDLFNILQQNRPDLFY